MQTINKIRFSFSMLMSLLVLIGLNTAFVACDDDDDEGFYLESFGPSPVMRGDTLTFIGKQLNKVSSVVFENGTEVTSVNFDGNGKFFIVVPEEAQSGYLTLKTTSGDYKTLTKLGVTDPVVISGVSPLSTRPEAEITISGKYFYQVAAVIISGTTIDKADFVSQSDDKIVVKVPKDAKTGDVSVSTGTEQITYSQQLNITLPVFTSWSCASESIYPGKTEITINGTDLDLVAELTFANGLNCLIADPAYGFVVTPTSITFTFPLNASKGAVKMYPRSGVECEAGSLDLSESDYKVVSPVPVLLYPNKIPGTVVTIYEGGDFFLGDKVTLHGENLDLIKSVSIGGVKISEFEISSDGTTITTAISELSVSEQSNSTYGTLEWGHLYSGWQNGFLVKMETNSGDDLFVGYLRNEWGTSGSVNGTDASVNIDYPANHMVTYTYNTKTKYIKSLKLNGVEVLDLPTTSITENSVSVYVDECYFYNNALAAVFSNGSSKTLSASFNSVTYPFVTSVPENVSAGSLQTVKGANFKSSTKFYMVDESGTSTEIESKGLVNEKTCYVTIPSSLSGSYKLMVTDGSNSYTCPIAVSVAASVNTLWEGSESFASQYSHTIGLNSGVDITNLGNAKITLYFTGTKADTWLGIQLQTSDGSNLGSQWNVTTSSGDFKIVIDKDVVSQKSLYTATSGGKDWTICGGSSDSGLKITKVEIAY